MESDEYKKLYKLLSELAHQRADGVQRENSVYREDTVPPKNTVHREDASTEKSVGIKIIKTEQEEIHMIPLSEMVSRKRGRPFKKKTNE